jgi:hypothetical protein
MKPYTFSKKSLFVVLSIVSIVAFTSCLKDIPPIFKGGDGKSGKPVVFVAGWELAPDEAFSIAKYWINGQEVILSDGTHNAKANSIFAKGNNLYIAGEDGGAVYWKNNAEIKLASIAPFVSGNSSANSIYVSGNDVYVAGIQFGNPLEFEQHAAYWKNGSEVILNPLDNSGLASSVFVSGNDIYVCGMHGSNAVYWKNGVEVSLTAFPDPAINPGSATANSIFQSGGNVYVVGTTSNFSPVDEVDANYWKNGTASVLNSSNEKTGFANSVFVSGNNVYVAGAAGKNYPQANYAVYWKNGAEIVLPSSAANAGANSIFVSGNDIYVAGIQFNNPPSNENAVYWKNGAEFILTNGTNDVVATSIFVK